MKSNFFILLISTLVFSCQSIPSRNISSEKTNNPKHFVDVTMDSGIPSIASTTFVVADYNNDGLTDFIAGNRLFKNESSAKDIKFSDITAEVELSDLRGNPLFIDINNDGLVDVLSTSGQLYIQNAKGYFVESSKKFELKIPENAHTISFGDINHDGWPDLIVGMNETEVDHKFSFVPSHVFQNIKGKKFIDVTSVYSFEKFPAYTRGVVWADYNNDGRPDFYFANYRLRRNYLFSKQGENLNESAIEKNVQGVFDGKKYYDEQMKTWYGPSFGHTIGANWVDFNNDGLFDLWVSNLAHKYVGNNRGAYDIRGYVCDDSKIYKNLGGPDFKFEDVRAKSNIAYKPIGDWDKYQGDELWSHSTAADFDNDGLVDMYVSQVYNLKYAHSLLFKNNGEFKFNDVADEEKISVIDSYGAAWADFNNDGLMDLIVSGREEVDAPAKIKIFKNITKNQNHFLKIKLIGKKSGKNPVGTQIRVIYKKGLYLKQYEGVTGTMNQQNDPVIHFGLGTNKNIQKIEVRWNSGKIQEILKPKIDQLITIEEIN